MSIRIVSWHRRLTLTNFNSIKLDDRAYIKNEISTVVEFYLTFVLISLTI